jgi:hypothetical protein
VPSNYICKNATENQGKRREALARELGLGQVFPVDGCCRFSQKTFGGHDHELRPPNRMPRKPPIRGRWSPGPSPHHFLPPGLKVNRSLIRRPSNSIDITEKKLPPKIVAMDVAPRIPLSPDVRDHARRLARIEQIKKLYSPKEFKRLRDQQMQLVLPESPLKTTSGRIRLGVLFWIYFSIMVCLTRAHR